MIFNAVTGHALWTVIAIFDEKIVYLLNHFVKPSFTIFLPEVRTPCVSQFRTNDTKTDDDYCFEHEKNGHRIQGRL